MKSIAMLAAGVRYVRT